jgi:hypothetical protein
VVQIKWTRAAEEILEIILQSRWEGDERKHRRVEFLAASATLDQMPYRNAKIGDRLDVVFRAQFVHKDARYQLIYSVAPEPDLAEEAEDIDDGTVYIRWVHDGLTGADRIPPRGAIDQYV